MHPDERRALLLALGMSTVLALVLAALATLAR
jgi:hypothetical protein